MTGFSPKWLALREPADHAARDRGLVSDLAAALPDSVETTIVDLGCGTGSNLRGLAPGFGARQSWRLVDHDPALVAAARVALVDWADEAEIEGEALALVKADKRIKVVFSAHDLSVGLGPLVESGAPPALVTAAALVDLASQAWLDGLVRSVVAAGSVFYTTLSYDGCEVWDPPHPADAAIHAAFLAHQRGDKGFGAAMGPGATAALAEAFGRHGYRVATAPSPWRLGGPRRELIRQLKDGKASAAAETGLLGAEEIERWATARSRAGTTATIGHADLLAVPIR